jgi:SPP1 family predicted phage head-tail adaptor
LDAPVTTVDFDHTFTAVGSKKWAALKTTKGRDMFFATNMDIGVTHIFYIRWYNGLTSEDWITFKGERYDIVEVENIDERDEWYAIYCNVRGDETQDQNDA